MRQIITIKYTGEMDQELDERLAGVLEHPPFNCKWLGQGYDDKRNLRDVSFERNK